MILADQVKCDKILRATVQERTATFRKYLTSEKFNQDTTIQVWEVLRFTLMLRNMVESRSDALNPKDFESTLASIT